MNKLYLAFLVTGLSGCAIHATDLNQQLLDKLSGLNSNNQLHCQFDKTLDNAIKPIRSNWYLWRDNNRIETRDDFSNQGEIWQRNATGQIFYTRLFYNEKVALEFTPGDLSAIGINKNWQALNSLVDINNFNKKLHLKNNNTILSVYTGIIDGIATEINWLPKLQLPASILKKTPEGVFTLALKNCDNSDSSKRYFSVQADSKNFRHFDFTDLGDMEDDPLVKKIEKIMGNHPHSN